MNSSRDSPGVRAQQTHEQGADPRITVVIIFLDAVQFLPEAIESILRQTYTFWELVLVDDGSSDGSSGIAADYAARYPGRIRCVEHPGHENRGMSAARNLGIHEAKGEFVAFLDADDVYLPQRLERHIRILDAWPTVDMVQSDLIYWYSWEAQSRRLAEDHVRPFLASSDRILQPPEGLLTVLAAPLFSAGICNITVRRQAAVDLGGFDPRFRAMYEDQVFTSKFYLQRTVYVLQDYLARYRRHPDSLVRRMRRSGEFMEGLANQSRSVFHRWLVQYVRESGIHNSLLREAIDVIDSGSVAQQRSIAQRWVASIVAVLKNTVLLSLPRPLYRRLYAWNWRRDVRKAQRQYQVLCRRVERSALTEHLGH